MHNDSEKFGQVALELCEWTGRLTYRQTDRQTDILITILLTPPGGEEMIQIMN